MPRYKLISEGESSQGAKVIDLATGRPLEGITSVDLHLRVDCLVRAEIGLLGVATEVEIGEAAFLLFDPLRGGHFPVKRIEYQDGSGLEVVAGRIMKFDAER